MLSSSAWDPRDSENFTLAGSGSSEDAGKQVTSRRDHEYGGVGEEAEEHARPEDERASEESLQRRLPALLDSLSISDGDFEVEFPEDVYSMLYLAPWNSAAFWYSLVVFALQMWILGLAFADLIHDPTGHKETNLLNVPPLVPTQVFIAQFLALGIAVLSQDDVTLSLMMISIYLAKEYPEYQSTLQQKYPNAATIWQFWMANLLRLAEGGFTVLVSFVFIVQSESVLQIFLNFAAIQFVSELDNLGHRLAQEGWFGYPIQSLARRMKGEAIPVHKGRNPIVDYVNRTLLLVIIGALFACNAVVVHRQSHGAYIKKIHCSVLDVKLGDELYALPPGTEFKTEWRNGELYIANSSRALPVKINPSDPPDLLFSFFSGRYEADFENKAGIENERPVYYEASKNTFLPSKSHDDATLGFFYYCEGEHAWVWTVRSFMDAGAVPKETQDRCEYGWLLRSPITQSVTLEEAPTVGWRVWTGVLGVTTPLSFACMECHSDIDCGLNRGVCGEDQLCRCHDFAEGGFCNQKTRCPTLMGIEGRSKESGPYYSFRDFDAYGRPIYMTKLHSGEYELLFYTRRRWAKYVGQGEEVERWLDTRSELHAYWFSSLLDRNFWYSEQTTDFLPTGPLKWYSVDEETRSEGSYGPFGRKIPVDFRAECLSVDCNVSTRICGRFGQCMPDEILTTGGKVVHHLADDFLTLKGQVFSAEVAVGGKCICDETHYGHFCEFMHTKALAGNTTNDEL